jgi:hypothetical protein
VHFDKAVGQVNEDGRREEQTSGGNQRSNVPAPPVTAGQNGGADDNGSLEDAHADLSALDQAEAGDADSVDPEQDDDEAVPSFPELRRDDAASRKCRADATDQAGQLGDRKSQMRGQRARPTANAIELDGARMHDVRLRC